MSASLLKQDPISKQALISSKTHTHSSNKTQSPLPLGQAPIKQDSQAPIKQDPQAPIVPVKHRSISLLVCLCGCVCVHLMIHIWCDTLMWSKMYDILDHIKVSHLIWITSLWFGALNLLATRELIRCSKTSLYPRLMTTVGSTLETSMVTMVWHHLLWCTKGTC